MIVLKQIELYEPLPAVVLVEKLVCGTRSHIADLCAMTEVYYNIVANGCVQLWDKLV